MAESANYHTHTYLCKHANGSVDDYCSEAESRGLQILGISDHTPLPDNRWSYVRMNMSDLDYYCESIDQARLKYAGLNILKSFECDYDPSYEGFFRDLLIGEKKADYLIGALHWFPHKGEWPCVYGGVNDRASLLSYTKTMIQAISSKLFAFIAHPDLFAGTYLKWDDNAKAVARDIIAAAVEYDVALEINDLGCRKGWIQGADNKLRPMYPFIPFWELAAEYAVKVVVNSDAHTPQDVASFSGAEFFLKQTGLQKSFLNIEL